MTIGFGEWLESFRHRRHLSIRAPVSVTGKHEQHLGPHWAFAEVELTAEPAAAWKVQVDLSEADRIELTKAGWLQEALFGVLDVLVSRPPDPLLRVRVNVTAVRCSFESSRTAFRAAGRRAAHALLDAAEIAP